VAAWEDWGGPYAIFDFVDAGLPSTVVPDGEYRGALGGLLSRIAAWEPTGTMLPTRPQDSCAMRSRRVVTLDQP
jgi:hypothetical protein